MYGIKRLLIALDLTELDQTLITYTSSLAKMLETEQVYFFHVAKSLELPSKVAEKYPDLLAPLDESITSDVRQNVEKHFDGDITYEIIVKEGNPADQIMRWGNIKAVDMIVVGRKLQLKGRGVLPGKLARLAHCSVLFVPENATPDFKRIMVPVDFSKNSNLALDLAVELKKVTSAKIILQNSYSVPWGYHTTGKSYEEFDEIMKGHAREDGIKFLKQNKVKESEVEFTFTLDKEHEPAERAYEEAVKLQADLIIMSSKGRSGLANFLLGSVASKMIELDVNIPLLVAKNKHDNMSFFEALLKI